MPEQKTPIAQNSNQKTSPSSTNTTPPEAAKKKGMSTGAKVGIGIGVGCCIVILILVIVALTLFNTARKKTDQLKEEVQQTKTTTKSYLEENYDKAVSAKVTAGRTEEINNDLLPMLEEIFTNVKLTESKIDNGDTYSSGSLGYVVKRAIKPDDVKSLRTKLEAKGYTIESDSGSDLTAKKDGKSITIALSVNSDYDSNISVSFFDYKE